MRINPGLKSLNGVQLSDIRTHMKTATILPISFPETFTLEYWVNKFCVWSEANGHTRNIYRNENDIDVLYLKRHYIYRGPNREIMIHQFFRGDTGDLHNHPAASYGRILVGGYYEYLCQKLIRGHDPIGQYRVWRGAGFFKWTSRPASDKNHENPKSYHKVELRPCHTGTGYVKTLFIMSKRNKNRWSFWQNGNPIDFEEKFRQDGTYDKQSRPENWSYGWFPTKREPTRLDE